MKKSNKTLHYTMALVCAFATMASADVVVTLESTTAQTVDLTTVGTLDWYSPGYNTGVFSTNQMAGADYISDISGRTGGFAGSNHTFSWSNGDPVPSKTGDKEQWEATGVGSALLFSVDGLNVGEYMLIVYGQTYRAACTLTASIGTTTNFASQGGTGSKTSVYSVVFDIENAGDSLDVAFKVDAGAGAVPNVGIAAVTLQAIPEPVTLGLIAMFGGGILFVRRRLMP